MHLPPQERLGDIQILDDPCLFRLWSYWRGLIPRKGVPSGRRRKAEDADVFAAMGRVMRRVGPAELTLGAIAAEAGITAGALVQRFGSKRELMLAHWRQAAAAGTPPDPAARAASPLQALRATAALYAKLAASPRAALRNLAYMQSDWADAALRRQVLRHARAVRARYEQLVTEAVAQGELRAGTDAGALARMIEVTLGGSFLAWTLHREGAAATRLREDLDATLRPHLTEK
jgi:AcrR family transcriptional regulator